MGNIPTGPKLDFSHPLLGNTVSLNSDTAATGTIISYSGYDEEVKNDDDDEKETIKSSDVGLQIQMQGQIHETTLDNVSFAAKPRSPYTCFQEEACAAWLWKRIPILIHQRLNSEESAVEGDKEENEQVMNQMITTESIMLGFLTVETKSQGEKSDWESLNLETMANKMCDTLEWRLNIKAHLVLNSKPDPTANKKVPGALHGFGLQGRPVLWTLPCWFEWAAISGDEIENIELRNQENVSKIINQLNENTTIVYRDAITIVNLDGMGLWVANYISKFTRHANVSEKRYPGRAWKSICINCSPNVSQGYNLFVKPCLSENTQNVVVMLAKGQATTDGLRKYIAPEFIPKVFGGEAKGNGEDDIMLEDVFFPDGMDETASKFKAKYLANLK